MHKPVFQDRWRDINKVKLLTLSAGAALLAGSVAWPLESLFAIAPNSHADHFLNFGLIWLALKLGDCCLRKVLGEEWLYKTRKSN